MYLLLFNPSSGRGAGLQLQEKIIAVMRERGFEYHIETACADVQADEIARRLSAETYEGVVVVGGDGTFFQTVNRLNGNSAPMIFVPCGTGNDFVRVLNLPKDPIDALKVQLDSPITQIDIGRMNNTLFLNVGGTGFDVEVLRMTEQYKDRYSGLSAYMHGLVSAIKDYKPVRAMISIDDAPARELRFAILSLGNGRYFGGGMKPVPHAVIDDGLFDLIIVKPVRKFMILPLIFFFVKGIHIKVGLGQELRCRKLTIDCKGMVVNLDGELLNTDRAEFELLASALKVRIPRR